MILPLLAALRSMFDSSLLCFLHCLRHGTHQLTQREAAQCHQMVVVLDTEASIIWNSGHVQLITAQLEDRAFLAGTGHDGHPIGFRQRFAAFAPGTAEPVTGLLAGDLWRAM